MSTERPNPRYLLRPADHEIPDDVRDVLVALGAGDRSIAPDEVPAGLPVGGGWLVAPPELEPGLLGRVLLSLGGHSDAWGFLQLVRHGDAIHVLPLSPGYAEAPARVAERLDAPGLGGGYLGHRRLLGELGHLRHDVNNALTSALAETQFLRMDAPEGSELAGSLEVVEAQLDRIRRITEALVALRVPPS